MKIDKDTVPDMLRTNGQEAAADQARQDLPDPVDGDQHAGLLDKVGIDPDDLTATFTGGGAGAGGTGGALGKLL